MKYHDDPAISVPESSGARLDRWLWDSKLGVVVLFTLVGAVACVVSSLLTGQAFVGYGWWDLGLPLVFAFFGIGVFVGAVILSSLGVFYVLARVFRYVDLHCSEIHRDWPRND